MPEPLIFLVAATLVGLALWLMWMEGRDVEIVDEDED